MQSWMNLKSVLFLVAAIVFALAGQDAGDNLGAGFDKFFYAMGVFSIASAAPKA